jgi:hypothetical protein
MPSKGREWFVAAKRRAFEMFAEGASAAQVRAETSIAYSTSFKWQAQARRLAALPGPPEPLPDLRPAPPSARRVVEDMILSELPDLTRGLLDQAKGGDVRAVLYLLKLLGHALDDDAQGDNSDELTTAAIAEFERDLGTVSPLLASQVVDLIIRANARAAAGLAPSPHRGHASHPESLPVPQLPEADPSHPGPDCL